MRTMVLLGSKTGSVSVVMKVSQQQGRLRIGVVGGGQLARMLGESASALGLRLSVLAQRGDDAAVEVAAEFAIGSPQDGRDLTLFAGGVDVMTFDHELVDLDAVSSLSTDGHHIYPSAAALRFAVHKVHQRSAMVAANIPVPRHCILAPYSDDAFDAFADLLGHVPVVKADHGGYDGRGVLVSSSLDEARDFARALSASTTVLLEEAVELESEVAVIVVTDCHGNQVTYPVVDTRQESGMCVEVNFPSALSPARSAEALAVARRVAEIVGAVGVLAVELFVTPSGILLNEVAARPHNSGHWTIEGSVTSQFENHLRAVSGLPLGSTDALAARASMVNLVGSDSPTDLAGALAIPGLHLHDYGKSWAVGRKLGHVCVIGDDESVRVRAWKGAELLGTGAARSL